MLYTIRSLLILLAIVCLQATVYSIFLHSFIFSWGASPEEVTMPLAGDQRAARISSTRAISIQAPRAEVWQWIIQLGADRGGFFSYAFIEQLLGYESHHAEKAVHTFHDLEVGRIIPGSLDESKSVIAFNFPVLFVESGKSFVLENWGTFALHADDANQTRLIVRTHGRELRDLKSVFIDFFEVPLHYLMERRMLMGFKSRVETGDDLSSVADGLWLLGIALSGIAWLLLIFVSRGMQRLILPSIYGVFWLWPLLVFDPQPTYSYLLLLAISVTITRSILARKPR